MTVPLVVQCQQAATTRGEALPKSSRATCSVCSSVVLVSKPTREEMPPPRLVCDVCKPAQPTTLTGDR